MAIYEVDGVEESDGVIFKTLPHGIYPAEIISCEFKEITKEGSDYKGATMLMYNVKATCPETDITSTANDIIILPCEFMDSEQKRKSLAKIKKLQIACGLEDMGNQLDNDPFLHCELQVELIEKDDPTYGKQNKIKDVMPI